MEWLLFMQFVNKLLFTLFIGWFVFVFQHFLNRSGNSSLKNEKWVVFVELSITFIAMYGFWRLP